MENMENVVMNEGVIGGDVMSTESIIGHKVGKGLFIAGLGAGIIMLGVKAVKKIKSIRQAKKDVKEDIIEIEYPEVVTDGE